MNSVSLRRYCKRLFSLTLICSIFITTLPLEVMAASSTVVPYAVTGGNIYFDTETGTVIGSDASIQEAIIPEEINGIPVTCLGEKAFSDYRATTSGSGTYMYYLKKISIPANVTSFTANISSCFNLSEFVVADGNQFYSSDNGLLYDKNKETLIAYPMGISETTFFVPDHVVTIAALSIINKNLKRIVIPSSVENIDYAAINSYCQNVEEICVDVNNQFYTSEDGVLFDKEKATLISYPIGKSGVSYSIPHGVKTIGTYAFNQATLEHVNIPNSVVSIQKGAFSSCHNLCSLTLPSSIAYIGDHAFALCGKLGDITIPDSTIEIGESAFWMCSFTNLILSKNVKEISKKSFSWCCGFSTLIVPTGVTKIGESAFEYGEFAELYLPDTLTAIGEYAFNDCDNLTDIYYAGTPEQWKKVSIRYSTYPVSNDTIRRATVHYNSIIPGEGTGENVPSFSGAVEFLRAWDPITRNVTFNGDQVSPYFIATSMDAANLGQLVGKYVLTMTNPNSPLEITDIQPVESKIGICSAINRQSMTIDGVSYSTPADWVLDIYAGKTVLYHSSEDEIISIEVLQKSSGILEEWNNTTQKVTIDGTDYPINYVTDLSFLASIDQKVGTKVTFYANNLFLFKLTDYTLPSEPVETTIDISSDLGVDSFLIGNVATLTATIKLGTALTSDDVIEWSTNNPSVVEFLENGAVVSNVRHSYSGNTLSEISDTVQIKGLSNGKATITCKLASGGARSFNITVVSKDEEHLHDLAIEWLVSYEKYISAIETTVEKEASSDIKVKNLTEVAKELEKKLKSEYNVEIVGATNSEQIIYICKALLKMLAEDTTEELAMAGISTSNLDLVPVDIVNKVANGIKTTSYTYQEGKVTVLITCANDYGARFGRITYSKVGEIPVTMVMKTTQAAVQSIISDYILELVDLEKSLLVTAYKEVFKSLSKDLFGKSASCLTEVLLKNKIARYVNEFKEAGLGNVPDILNRCYNYYKFVEKIQKGNYSEAAKVFAGIKEVDFGDPSITDNLTKAALKGMENARENIEKFMNGEPIDTDIFYTGGGFSIVSMFKCPVNITVYDSSDNQIGYVGEDDIWYDADVIYIEQYGNTKTIYSNSGNLHFELVATDYGVLNCTFEEFSDGVAVNRVNYYDILLNDGKTVSAKIPSADLNEITVIVTASDGVIPADETISFADYSNATVSITCSKTIAQGGQLIGAGEYVRGDAVKLIAAPESNYAFLGWQDNNGTILSLSKSYEFVAKEDVELTALFVEYPDSEDPSMPTEYTIRFDANGGVVNPAYATTGSDGKLNDFPIPTRSNYTFDGWYTNIVGGDIVTTATVFTEDSTIYAHWTYIGGSNSGNNGSTGGSGHTGGTSDNSNSHAISVSTVTGGRISVTPKRAPKGEVITITVTPNTGYELDHLTVTEKNGTSMTLLDKRNGTYTFTMPNSSVSIDAAFRRISAAETLWSNPFTDVANTSWYYDAVKFANQNGLMSGTSDSTFTPSGKTTRGMLVTILYRLEGSPTEENSSGFDDVEVGKYYTDAINWANANNIVTGYNDHTFKPELPITREEMATILYRYAAFKNYYIGGNSDMSNYADKSQVSSFAMEPMQWAVANQLINGSDGKLDPRGQATRAQIAAILMRFCENMK